MMRLPNRSWPETNRPSRSGQVLIEFSFIVLILYILMAVTVDFGRALYSAQIVQQAADVAARELSRTPMPPTITRTVPVVEEILTNPNDLNSGTFSLLASTSTGQSGLVALRINFPFQAAGMTGFMPQSASQTPVLVPDSDFNGTYGPYANPE